MMDIILPQADADALMVLEKHRINDNRHSFPYLGEGISVPLQSPDKKEQFILDISRGKIDFLKLKYQTRARKIIVLVRLDLGTKTHWNPDGQIIQCPHLHFYREDYGTKWAFPIPIEYFPDISDPWKVFEDFLKYCHITQPPFIDRGLF